jgi:uncharacterized protein YbjT (DUF2867 family)
MMVFSNPYVVTSAAGRTGSAAARQLLAAGLPVRVVLRTEAKAAFWQQEGAEVVLADLTDLEAMRAALAGAAGAYIVTPPEYEREDLFERAEMMGDMIARAVVEAGLPKAVVLSSVGAEQPRDIGWIAKNRSIEQQMMRIETPLTFIRAAYFMENWLPMIAQALATGVLPSFLSPLDRPLPMNAAQDVGHAAAAMLLENWQGQRIVNVAGPHSFTPQELANHLAAALGRPIQAQALPEEAWPAAMAPAGFSPASLRGFIEMTRSLNNGHIAFQPGLAMRRGTTSLSSWLSTILEDLQPAAGA